MKMSKEDIKLKCNKNFWQLATDEETGAANLYIYSEVASDGVDFYTGQERISDTSARHFKEELDKLGNVSQINVYINSKGGDVGEGIGIYSQLKRHKAHKTAYIDGYACSVASVIPMACDEVVISPPATMMIHPAWSIVMGNAAELRKCADDLDKITESTKQAYLLKSGDKISEAKLTELMNAETWLTAQECIKYGFADRILGEDEPKPDNEEPDKKDEPPENPDGENEPEEPDKKKDEPPENPDGENEPEEPDKKKENEDFNDKAMSIIGNFFM